MNRDCNITLKYHETIEDFIVRFVRYLERKKSEEPTRDGLRSTYRLRTGVEIIYYHAPLGDLVIRASGPMAAMVDGLEHMERRLGAYKSYMEVDHYISQSSRKHKVGWGAPY